MLDVAYLLCNSATAEQLEGGLAGALAEFYVTELH